MTTGDTEETCGGGKETCAGGKETCAGGKETGGTAGAAGRTEPPRSVTALSTVAVQAGRALLVVSVLQSGSLVHLQLVQVHPGLCEVGLNQEENQTLMQEQQQLIKNLKKHEREVLSVVERKRQTEQMRRKSDEGVVEHKRTKPEEEEDVHEAMVASLTEGWTLLLRLLQSRLQVLRLAADFHQRAAQFAVSLDRLEALQSRPDRLNELQLTYDSMRKGLLVESLQVLSSSSVLLQELRRLQRTEALQRTGGALQEEQEEQEELWSSQCSGGAALRLEELVEALQDRRRTADQAARLQLQQAKNCIVGRREDPEDWKILDQDLQPGSRSDVRPGSTSDVKPGSRSDVKPGSTSDVKPGSTSDVKPGSTSDVKPGSRSDVKPGSTSDVKPGSRSDVKPGSTSDVKPGSTSDVKPESRSDVKPGSRSDVKPGSTSDVKPGSTSDVKPGSTSDVRPGSTSDVKPGSRSDVKPVSTSDVKPGSTSDVRPVSTSDVKPGSTADVRPRSTSDVKPGSTSDVKPGSRSDVMPDFRLVETRIFELGSSSELKSGSKPEATKNLQSGCKPNLMVDSGSEESRDPNAGSRSQELQSGWKPEVHIRSRLDLEPASRSGLNSDPRSDETIELQSGSGPEETRNQEPEVAEETRSSVQAAGQQSMLVKETSGGEGHAHQTLMTNQRLQLLSSCDQLVVKVSTWLQQSSSLLSHSSEVGRQLSEAEHTLHTHLQLRTQTESAVQEVENMKPHPPGGTGRQLSPLKALTEQLKRGGAGGRTRTGLGPPSPDISGRVDLVLKELQSLNKRIDSNLQLLQPFISFLQKAQQVEKEMEELREVYRTRLEEGEAGSSRKKKEQKQLDSCWQETLQKISTCEKLGEHYVQTFSTVTEELNLQSLVQQTLEQLGRTKQEVNRLRSQQQIQIQEKQPYCRKYQERLHKTLQDLNCVSEMLDSCTLIDLGSALQTSRLLEHFSQARPHFIRLDAEVEFMVKSWETLSGVQNRLEVEQLKEEDLSRLLQLQERVKNKIHQSEWILDLSSSFHLTDRQLKALLQSDPATGSTGSCGTNDDQSRLREKQIQSLFEMASTLRTDICSAVTHSGWTGFRVEELETRLVSLDSLCVSSLKEGTRREDELLTRILNDDITQLRDSFKELKKRFSNLRFNYLKRNDRTRNTKAARNQLQQVELYEEKLQVLRKRLQGAAARLGSEVKDRGVAKEAEDAVNELQRQMGEFDRSVNEHQKTLEMTCRLQQATEEYQFWCEDASATIARVGKFSSECRSTEAVSVLYRQFEKFVWPTVPQQEERISQITELAVRLHGVEEGRRYTEKTVSKHSDMMEAIRKLSDGLMELEKKLKSLSQQNEEEEIHEEEEKERKMKENRKMKKEQNDNRCSQEADMYELKETGHTPELTAEHDGKEPPVKRQSAANRKPPLQKSRSQEADRQTDSRQQSHSEKPASSYRSSHSFSLSCSPVEPNRRVHAINSQSQPAATVPQATPPPYVIGPTFSDIQREFQKKEKRVVSNMTTLQDASAGHLTETQLQQQEVMTDDSFSNDEYDCASPDDISLPPLAETPESYMVQSDVEEGFCFSSHSVHISHSSHQLDHSSTGTATGAARQRRESSQTESCPTPPNSRHSSTRFRAESSSFVQSPLTVPAQSLLTSTLCSILKTGKTSTANAPQSNDLSLGVSEPGFSSRFHHESDPPDSCSNKDHDVPEKRSPSHTDPLLKEPNSQYNPPQIRACIQGKITQHVASKDETLPQTDPNPQVAELNQSCCPQPFDGPDRDLHKDNPPPQDTGFLKCSTTFSHYLTDSDSDLHQDMKSSRPSKETSIVSKPQSDSPVIQQSSFFSLSDSQCLSPQSETLPQNNLVPQPVTDPVLHQDRTIGLLKSCAPCIPTTPTTPTLSQDRDVCRSNLDSRSGFDQDAPSSQTSKETSSVITPQSSSLTTATTVKQSVFCQAFPPNSHCTLAQTGINLRSQQDSLFSQSGGALPEVHAPVLAEPNSISNISLSSSNRFSSEQSHQTVYSFHESLTSSCTQQCVHDPGMTPIKPTAPPPPEPQTQALAPQANLHVTPLSSPLHLLTPDQDPNICQPVAIREEIRLTPQIQGPPFPAPPPRAQAESLPQGKASKPVPPCFTRPLSRATIMEGSPVTLEVEVTGDPEPRLTWCKGGEALLPCEDRKHFLFIPEASDSDDVLNEPVGDEDDEDDEWLLAQVFDIISIDWHTWFGTLCALLWLIYLILL
ncbi:coiled-coil domain-containing protein 141 isoform X2 [Clinocottus analis]|uniref:coiled-coil domain-containing protein 141 isoform X2 n=1 Tax=Clinocottus analis TaxID=304258 RepID=UPI0035BF07AD